MENNLFNIFESTFFSRLYNYAKPDQKGISTILSAFIAALLIFFIISRNLFKKRKPNFGYDSYSDSLPYHRYIPLVKLPILEGLIFWYKFRKDGVKVLESIVSKDKPICRLSYGIKTAVVVADPNIIQKLLSSNNPGHLAKPHSLYVVALTNMLKDGLLVADVDTWSSHRKVLSPAFKYKSLPTYFQIICKEAKELIHSACSAAAKTNGGMINNQKMASLIDHHAVKTITHIIMGSDSFHFSDEQRILFHENFKRQTEINTERFQRPELMIPIIWWLHPIKKEMDMITNKFEQLLNQLIDKYRNNRCANERPQDAVVTEQPEKSSQLYTKENAEQREEDVCIKPFECLVELMINAGSTNKEIADEIATFMAAGHETVKVALDMLSFHLAGNPEHQEKCRAEVDNLFNSKGDGEGSDPSMDQFSKLKYLEMCIQESMRLTPTIAGFARELQEPLQVDDNSVIYAKEIVVVLPWVLHRNPDIYPYPEKYDPTRFLPDNVKQRHPYSFIPFSMGARNCIGWKVALLEMKVIMAWILRYFEIYTSDGPNDVKLFYQVTLKPERPYNVTFKRRLDIHLPESR